MEKPYLLTDFKLLFRPVTSGNYINDHSIVKAHDGSWHLFGITSHKGGAANERYFAHAKSSTLWGEEMTELKPRIDTGTLAWAPAVITSGKDYYMYYGPSPTKMAISPDLNEWMGYEIEMCGTPPMSCHRDHFVLKLNDYTWIMYVVGTKDHRSAVSCLVSNDLLHWRFVQYALTSAENTPLNPPWGAFESPFVVKRDDVYYLFLTYTDCKVENYRNTLVFTSKNPYDFGEYSTDRHSEMVVAELPAHAGEVIFDPDTGEYYLTSCGWNGKGLPASYEGGVGIAKLGWGKQ